VIADVSQKNMPRDTTFLSQCGEYLVAAELNRRRIFATVTYGNLKSMDVIALADDGRFASVEVKTSRKQQFPTGLTKNKQKTIQENKFWVLVSLDFEPQHLAPEFFVLSDAEIQLEQAKEDKIYNSAYSKKHGMDYDKDGVPNIKKKKLEEYRNGWSKIADFLITKKG
jgi:hypothetical protein